MLKQRWPWAAAALLLCGLFSGPAENSGATVSAESPFIVDFWESGPGDQKLPEGAVIALTQTQDGYLWLGTLGGLVRFDGTRFTVFNKANTPGLDSNRIVHLFEDSAGNLWVGTETAGTVLIKRDGQVSNLGIGREDRGQGLRFACEDSTGAVWLNLGDGGVVRCRGTNGSDVRRGNGDCNRGRAEDSEHARASRNRTKLRRKTGAQRETSR